MQNPAAVDPGPDFFELAEVDFWIEVGGEILAVITGIDIQDVNGVQFVEIIFLGQCAPSVDYPRVETDTENGRDFFCLELIFAFPFVVGIPGRVFANFVLLLVNRGIHVNGAGFQAGFHDRHIDVGLADINDYFRFCITDQVDQGWNVQRIDLTRI